MIGLLLRALLLAALLLAPSLGLRAQVSEAPSDDTSGAVASDADADASPADSGSLLGEEELDDLVAPIALYPDALLAQVLVAATYPLDIVKADRWVEDNAELEEDARADAADAEGWDPSVSVLAAGFPTVIDRMAEDLDRTEALGDALLVQSDDVLAAIQRMRARADAVGNLESNEAQNVTIEDDQIYIEPADPEVVYVPTYDSVSAYTTPAAAAPVVVAPSEVSTASSGFTASDMLVTGGIAFGTALLVNELFDDDDDDWYGYWGPRYRPFDWDDDNFYPRPGWGGGNFSGNDVDIDIGEINIDRDRLNIDRDGAWKPDRERKDRARDKIAKRKDGDRRPGAAKPSDRLSERDELKRKINQRSEGDRKPVRAASADRTLPKKASSRDGAFTDKNRNLSGTKQAKQRAEKSSRKANLADRQAGEKKRASPKADRSNRKIERPAGGGQKKAKARKPDNRSAFSKGGGGQKARGGGGHKQAKARGGRSAGKKRR